jgi:hypothetical protein
MLHDEQVRAEFPAKFRLSSTYKAHHTHASLATDPPALAPPHAPDKQPSPLSAESITSSTSLPPSILPVRRASDEILDGE